MRATNHAYERAKERMSWNSKTLDRMMIIALEKGLKHADCKGRLRKYINKLWLTHKKANNIRIYGQTLYLFQGEVLITIFRVPNNIVKYVNKGV